MDDLIVSTDRLPERQASHEAAVERVIRFAQQFGEVHLDLACHAAFPLALTPDLLYRIWANFVPQAPWTAVADILLSRLCREVGYELYEMDIAVRDLLLKELKEDDRFGQRRLSELADFLTDYVAQQLPSDDPDVRDLAQAQQWTALAYTRPGEAAHKLAEALLRLVGQYDSKDEQGGKAELIRIGSLMESFNKPLGDFEPLLAYARGMANLARGDQEDAAAELSKVLERRNQVRVAGVSLPIPKQMRLAPVASQQSGVWPVELGESPADFVKRDHWLDFANREPELQYLLNPGSPRYVEIAAPAGYGKTYLLDQLERSFAEDRWRIVRVNFDQPKAPKTGEEALAAFGQQLNQPGIRTIDRLAEYIFREGLQLVFLLDSTEHALPSFRHWLADVLLPQLEEHRVPPIEPQRVIAAGRHRVDEWHRFGRPRFESLQLSPFHAGIIETVLKEQVNKRDNLQIQPEPQFYRDLAGEIFDLSKGHPLCICNVVQWLDAKNFAIPRRLFRRNRARIFDKQIRPVIEEQVLGHLTERDTLEVVRLFCVLRGYNFDIVSWLAQATSKDQSFPDELRDILKHSTRDKLGTLRKLNATQLDGRIEAGMCRFDTMIRQLISLQVELEKPALFWRVHSWAARMYDYWIEGVNRPGKPLPNPPTDSTQAGYMVEALYHHARLMYHKQVTQSDAAHQLSQQVQCYCQQARSAAGWKWQTIQEFVDLVHSDAELIDYLELVVGQDRLGTVMAPAHAAVIPS